MKTSLFALSATLALAASAVSGSVVTAQFNGVSPGRQVSVDLDDPSSDGTYNSGRMNWTQQGPVNPILEPTFTAFCIELTQNVANGDTISYQTAPLETAPQPNNSVVPMGALKANLIRELFGRYFPDVFGDSSTMIMPIGGSFSASERNAAFQIAIWEIIYETDTSPNSPFGLDLDITEDNARFNEDDDGFSSISGDTETLAQAFLDGLDGTGPRSIELFALVSQTRQDMLVPTPGAAAMLGLGGLLAMRRRRK
jgi:hypothetical protein